MKTLLVSVLWVISLVTCAQIPNLSLPNAVDGSTISLEGCPSCAGIVVLFTSASCPYDGYYTDRIRSLTEAYAGKIRFLLVNSSPDATESVENMKAAYGRWNIQAPYLADKEQALMNALGAKKSTEVFLLTRSSGGFSVFYNGAVDDNPQAPQAVTANYLKDAIDNLLAGKKNEVTGTRVAGCTIRKK